jgi:hypothetical protein
MSVKHSISQVELVLLGSNKGREVVGLQSGKGNRAFWSYHAWPSLYILKHFFGPFVSNVSRRFDQIHALRKVQTSGVRITTRQLAKCE